jgi:hypothetical protein
VAEEAAVETAAGFRGAVTLHPGRRSLAWLKCSGMDRRLKADDDEEDMSGADARWQSKKCW